LATDVQSGDDLVNLPQRYVTDEKEIITEIVDGYRFQFPAGYLLFVGTDCEALSFRITMPSSEILLDMFINK
jgi:hypothetical protein